MVFLSYNNRGSKNLKLFKTPRRCAAERENYDLISRILRT